MLCSLPPRQFSAAYLAADHLQGQIEWPEGTPLDQWRGLGESLMPLEDAAMSWRFLPMM